MNKEAIKQQVLSMAMKPSTKPTTMAIAMVKAALSA